MFEFWATDIFIKDSSGKLVFGEFARPELKYLKDLDWDFYKLGSNCFLFSCSLIESIDVAKSYNLKIEGHPKYRLCDKDGAPICVKIDPKDFEYEYIKIKK